LKRDTFEPGYEGGSNSAEQWWTGEKKLGGGSCSAEMEMEALSKASTCCARRLESVGGFDRERLSRIWGGKKKGERAKQGKRRSRQWIGSREKVSSNRKEWGVERGRRDFWARERTSADWEEELEKLHKD